MIVIFSFYLITLLIKNKNINKFLSEGQQIETIWTLFPVILLLFIAFPSLKTLYLIEDTKHPQISIKIMGHQWFWSSEFSKNKKIEDNETEIFIENSHISRLLKTTDITKIPTQSSTRFIISSADVIHSWAVPSLGVKVDALPGRINQVFVTPKRIGLFLGQCSEICGANHSFIPIVLQVCSQTNFTKVN